MRFKLSAALSLLLVLVAGPAFAHSGHHAATGFGTGFLHPFSGLDHVAAMVTIGIWATQFEEKKWWGIPAMFLGLTVVGFMVGAHGFALPRIEVLSGATYIALGVVIAVALRLSWASALPVAALFGAVHGVGHGVGLPAEADPLSALIGFLAATTLMIIVGGGVFLFGRNRWGQRNVQVSVLGIAAVCVAITAAI